MNASAILRPDTLEATLMSLPAFVEEAIGESTLAGMIAAWQADDGIELQREMTRVVTNYLDSWVADHRRSVANKTGRISEEQALRDGIAIFTETARKWPIGLVRS